MRCMRLCPPGCGGQPRAVRNEQAGGFGLDSAGSGARWQGLVSGSVKTWQKCAGWAVR